MSRFILIGWAAVLLLILSWLVWQKEQTAAHGRVVLLELAPRDPRSLMQGDYMVLTYRLPDALQQQLTSAKPPQHGHVILKLDAKNIGTLQRLDDGTPIAADEIRLRFRNRQGRLRLGAESFFFQEGDAGKYAAARYGELRVDAQGNSVLIGLRDANQVQIGRPVIR
jgi:uncharacterized membrane-anchored protein